MIGATRQSMLHRITQRVSLALLLGAVGIGTVGAERIQLDDGTEFSATVLEKDGRGIVLRLPRASVAAIDGTPLPPPVAEGEAAPAFSVRDLDGATHILGVADGEATLVHFWASWCPYCRKDVGLMKELYVRYQDQGLRMVMVSVDQDRGKLDEFITTQELPYPVVAAFSDPASLAADLPDRYEQTGVPAYFLVNPQGTITNVVSGSVVAGNFDLEGAIQRILPQEP